MPLVVGDGVFDAWSWCESDLLEWRAPRERARAVLDTSSPIDADNPPGLVFVLRGPCSFLPRELARLHAFGHGLTDEEALAPYGIDDATDLLYEHRVRPRDVLWLAAPTLAALLWGLHDWAHFHNHGPFDDPPATELQCDLVALAWLRQNREELGLSNETLSRVTGELVAISTRRYEEARRTPPFDLARVFSDYPKIGG